MASLLHDRQVVQEAAQPLHRSLSSSSSTIPVAPPLSSSSSSQSNQAMLFYGQRLSLLGSVTSAIGRLIAQEEAERQVLRRVFAQSMDKTLEETFVPFEPFRIGVNRVETEEHEARWEMVHEESSLHKEMFQLHNELMFSLTVSYRDKQRMERAVLEREATLRILEMVCHWEKQLQELSVVFERDTQVMEKVGLERKILDEEQQESRLVITESEALKRRCLSRMFIDERERRADMEEEAAAIGGDGGVVIGQSSCVTSWK